MSTSRRFPASYIRLAGLAGAIAWSFPYIILPFIPHFPPYEVPPFRLPLTETTLAYVIAGLLAGGLFLAGLGLQYNTDTSFYRPVLSFPLVLVALFAAAAGSATAVLFGYLISYTYFGMHLMVNLETLFSFYFSPEPLFSLGVSIGAGLGVMIILIVITAGNQLAQARPASVWSILKTALTAALMALIGRMVVFIIEFSSFTKYHAAGQSLAFTLVVLAIGGAIFGALTWNACSKFNQA